MLDRCRGVSGQSVETDEAQDDAISIDDDQWLAAHPIAQVPNPIVQSAHVNIALRDICDSWDMGLLPLAGQPGSEPVGLSSLIAIDVVEPEANEPRRGPGAHISLVVVAIRDDRTVRNEPLGSFSIQGLQRNVDGPRDVLSPVLFHAEDIHELGTLLD
jgi:hypothetical protein